MSIIAKKTGKKERKILITLKIPVSLHLEYGSKKKNIEESLWGIKYSWLVSYLL